jgi:hypothetical protein
VLTKKKKFNDIDGQIDALTLKTLCMQHGPLKQFQLWLSHNVALVQYGSGREAQKVKRDSFKWHLHWLLFSAVVLDVGGGGSK